MSLRRATLALSLLATVGLGAGVATSADANPPCDQVAQPCATYDALHRTTAAFLFATYAACEENVPVGAVCTTVETVAGTAYSYVFFPYQACYDVQGKNGCIGPL